MTSSAKRERRLPASGGRRPERSRKDPAQRLFYGRHASGRSTKRRRETAERRVTKFAAVRPGGLWDLPGTADAKKARKVIADLDEEQSASTRQRLDLLAEPVDAELLHEYSEKLQKKIKAREEEAERIRIGAAPSPDKTLLATSSTKVSYDRFSRFAHRCRLAALDDYPVRDRGSQFLLKTLSDAYDAVWQANAAVTAPPNDDPNVDVKPPEIPVVPDVARQRPGGSAARWRRSRPSNL